MRLGLLVQFAGARLSWGVGHAFFPSQWENFKLVCLPCLVLMKRLNLSLFGAGLTEPCNKSSSM